jgi:DNA modification methylase
MRVATKDRTSVKSAVQVPVMRFTADEIVLRPVDDLVPFPNNPKIHTPEQIAAIAANIKEFGFDQPILVDENSTILKGHGRHLAARKADLTKVPTIMRKGLTAAQKWAVVISDNSLPAMTGFDNKLLRVGLTTLAKLDYPLHLTGFSNVRLATFVGGSAGNGTPDDLPDLAPAISKPGDVWMMGKHRLICGDATDKKVVAKLLGEDDPKLMATDPPYNLETKGGGLHKKLTTRHGAKIEQSNLDDFEVSSLVPLRDTNVIFTSKRLLADYLDLAREKKLNWDVAVLHRKYPTPAHNGHLMPDLDYVVLIGKLAPRRGLEQDDYSKLFSTGHWDRPVPWAKPVELMNRILRLYSDGGDAVFEPYCGSGTMIIAAETTGRACLACELNPTYVDLAVRRWQKFASAKATLQGSKKTFDQLDKERSKAAA